MLFRMKTTFIRFAMALWLAASYHGAAGQESKSTDQSYQHLAEEIVASHLAWNPAAAVELGFHEFDGKVIDLSRASIDRRHAQLRDFRATIRDRRSAIKPPRRSSAAFAPVGDR